MFTFNDAKGQVIDTCTDYSFPHSTQSEVVLLYGPGCGYCEKAKDDLISLKKEYADLKLSFTNVTPFEESDIPQDYSLVEYRKCYDALKIISRNKVLPQLYYYDGSNQKFNRISKGWSNKSISRLRNRLDKVYENDDRH